MTDTTGGPAKADVTPTPTTRTAAEQRQAAESPAGETLVGTSLGEAVAAVEEAEEEYRPPPIGLAGRLVTAVAVFLLGVAMLIGSVSLGVGTASAPSSGMWPMLVSVVLVVLSAALVAMAPKATDGERFSRTALLVLAGLATMVGFVAVIETIGFEIPAALLTFVWVRFLGRESWRTSIITSIAVTVAFYLIFVVALSVPIPHLF
ncbi:MULTISPECIES: tripartite tricarboxylate transporter TctB family protein [Actinoalloteichus]|uniref:tripartite tricarboxylate transporter TctB family protein n=1 Tax=Actinoalloteichus TaxID=65496 RepID=UPI0009F960C8|nr:MULTISPECIES: tripartite tricarboxylate transporter TctB family protein [Actinoalloteichus]